MDNTDLTSPKLEVDPTVDQPSSAADNEAAVRTVVDTARIAGATPFQTLLAGALQAARGGSNIATFVSAHKARAGHARTLGIGCSNGANMLTSVALAEPGLFDDIALLHPLIPWRPRDDARLASLRSSSRGAGAIPSARRN